MSEVTISTSNSLFEKEDAPFHCANPASRSAPSEFNVGDEVTFNSYGVAIPAKVLRAGVNLTGDDRVWYELTGTNPRKPLVTICTGRFIWESALYEADAA